MAVPRVDGPDFPLKTDFVRSELYTVHALDGASLGAFSKAFFLKSRSFVASVFFALDSFCAAVKTFRFGLGFALAFARVFFLGFAFALLFVLDFDLAPVEAGFLAADFVVPRGLPVCAFGRETAPSA